MTTLPIIIPEQTTRALPSFNFIEFSSGKGVVDYYGLTTRETGNAAVSGSLVDNSATYSDTLYTIAPVGMTFDTNTFNRTMVMDGTCTIFAPTSMTSAGTGWYNFDIQRVDSNGSPTTLLSLSGGQVTSAGQTYKYAVLKGNITNQIIKPGEKIRLSGSTVNEADMSLGHDPADRDTGIAGASPFGDDALVSVNGRTGTRMIFRVSFKADGVI